MVPLGVLETLNKVKGLNQRLILRRRMERQQMRQSKELSSVGPIKAPHHDATGGVDLHGDGLTGPV
jgi:hypothetical protein